LEKYLDKLPKCPDTMKKYMNLISKYSFYLALFIELTIVILEKSAYIIQYEGWWFRITFGLFGISLITTKRDRKQWLWFVVFALVGVVSYGATGRNEILRWIVFIWACYGKDMKKVLKFTFWYTAAGCLVIALLSLVGVGGDVAQTAVYRSEIGGVAGEIETRYCFGMGHPNTFHGMMLVLTWLGIYCYYEKIKWYGYGVIGLFHIAIFLFTDSRTGLLMSVGTFGLVVIMQYWKQIQEKKLPYIMALAVVVGAVAFSVFAAKYSVFHPLLKKVDGVLSGRIFALINTMDSEGMLHTWSLWSKSKNTYFFDLGIVRFFYWYGIIPGILYFLAQCRLIWCGYKRKDYILAVILVVITIYSIFEAHFISDYMGRNYILFFFGMYLADMLGESKKDKQIDKKQMLSNEK